MNSQVNRHTTIATPSITSLTICHKDPVLYERLVKRHQSHAERESEGKAKGYGRTLEADLIRGETKLSNISSANKNQNTPATGDETWDQEVENKTHGLALWREFLTDRFVKGDDEEFDYATIDSRDDLDTLQRAEEEEQWYDEEEPSWHEDRKDRHGETGVQDF